jgi:hypothetical protein
MHEDGEAGGAWPISRRLLIAGSLSIVALIGVAAGGGSYLATKNAVSPVVSVTTQTPVAVPTATVPAPGTTPTISPSVPMPTAAASPSVAASAHAVRPAQTAPPTKTVSATATPPARTTRPSPVCVSDPTWAVRQEQARISREAQRFDMNVQINMAINSGDLDEAARLQNDMQALEQQWVIEDQLDPEPAC